MANREWRRTLVIAVLWLCALPTAVAERPNIVFLLVDDLGWADIGANGSTFYETPNIDALAASGMRFTTAYAACPVCSPTRASLLTGRHPVRVDITDWIPGRPLHRFDNPRFQHVNDRDQLALEEVTLAEVLKEHQYQTFFAGKWHLGGEGFLPTDQGFDINIGGFHVGSPPGGYYSPWKNPHLQARNQGEYLTQRLTEESIQFLRERDPDRPFLLYLSWYNVHTPIQPDRRSVDHYREKAGALPGSPGPLRDRSTLTRPRQDNPEYASMVSAVDRGVGDLMQTLDELNLSDNTVVCFFSDNGGLSTMPHQRKQLAPTCNSPLRAGKGWLYEGGIREPMIIRAPGVTSAGSVSHAVVSSTDFFPTLLDLAGIPLRPDLHADGLSLMSVLDGSGDPPERRMYWHYPHYHGSDWRPGAAIRDGRWKLIEFYEEGISELYDLQADPGEQTDLSRQHPDQLAVLQQKLQAWQSANKAQMPQPNPMWQPAKSLFRDDNLVAWCIVPFDSAQRTPAQRAEMVRGLGLSKIAYDWRQSHVSQFEEEILQYRKNGLEFFAFWDWHDSMDPLIRKHGIRPQIWKMMPAPQAKTQEERVHEAATAMLPLVRKTAELQCLLGLYNHGGWTGEPENMAAVCEHLHQHHDAKHVGIVYNFHHGHEHIDDFSSHLQVMRPWLLCVNLNGMDDAASVRSRRDPILPLAEGQYERGMLRTLLHSGYQGPIGILDHQSQRDTKKVLQQNLAGLRRLQADLTGQFTQ